METAIHHRSLNINIGVFQGSVFFFLFLIYINDLFNCYYFNKTLHADDSVLTLSHKNGNCMQTMLNLELPKISVWLKSNQLSLNVNKAIFSQKSKKKSFHK